jgi:hypothetical protein
MAAFTTIQSNRLSAPPYLLCWIVIAVVAFVSDHLNGRGPVRHRCRSCCGTAVAVRYFGLFLSVQIFVSVAMVLTCSRQYTCDGIETRWRFGHTGDWWPVWASVGDTCISQNGSAILPQGDVGFLWSMSPGLRLRCAVDVRSLEGK